MYAKPWSNTRLLCHVNIQDSVPKKDSGQSRVEEQETASETLLWRILLMSLLPGTGQYATYQTSGALQMQAPGVFPFQQPALRLPAKVWLRGSGGQLLFLPGL